MEPRIFTVGHSTRTIEEFLALLEQHHIDKLIDVRRYPGSRRYPHFSKEALPDLLKAQNIGYLHDARLGGRRTPRKDSPNTYWENAQFRAYADHMDSEEFQSALKELVERAQTATQAIMCAEAVPWRCHRQLLSDALVAHGVDVVHIIGSGSTRPHELNPAARVLPNHHLVYSSSGPQMDLL